MGKISMRMLILSYSLQLVVHKQCLYQFQNPTCSSSWGMFDKNFSIHDTGVRDGKKKKKEDKINFSILVFTDRINFDPL